MIKFLTTLLIVSIFLSCTTNDKQKDASLTRDSASVVTTNNNAGNRQSADYFKIDKDSITILPFEIEINLSQRAEERMTKEKETIIVNVSFTGAPKDSSEADLAEDGSYYIASAEKEIVYGQVARFDSIKFSREVYDQLADKDIELGVNVYSGRKSSRDNLLDCEPMFDKISNVVGKKFTLNGKLIYGDD